MFWQVLSLTAVILDVKWKICWQFLVTSDAIPQLGAVHPWARHRSCRTLPNAQQCPCAEYSCLTPYTKRQSFWGIQEKNLRAEQWSDVCTEARGRHRVRNRSVGGRRLMTSNPADLNPPVCTVSLSSEGGCSLRWLSLTQICLINLVGGTFWQRTRLCVSWTDEEWYLIERMHH